MCARACVMHGTVVKCVCVRMHEHAILREGLKAGKEGIMEVE